MLHDTDDAREAGIGSWLFTSYHSILFNFSSINSIVQLYKEAHDESLF